MAEVVLLPRLSDTMTEGIIAAWHKNVGDAVKKGDLLAEIETDKATMELESYQEGVLLHIGTTRGGKLQVNDLLVIIGKWGEDISEILVESDERRKERIEEYAKKINEEWERGREEREKIVEEMEKERKKEEDIRKEDIRKKEIRNSRFFNRNYKPESKIAGTFIIVTILMIFIGFRNQLYLPINKFNPDIELENIIKIIFKTVINFVFIILLVVAEIVIFFIANYIIIFLNLFYFNERIKEKSDKTNFYLIILLFPIFLYLLLGRFLFYFIKIIEIFTLKIITHSNYIDLNFSTNSYSSKYLPLNDYKVNNWRDINVYYVVFFPLTIPITLTLKSFQTTIILILIIFFEIGGVFIWILDKANLILQKCNNLIISIWNEINKF